MHVTFDSLKTFYNILVQKLKNHRGNWEQNDPDADDYIKNRPFYSEGVKETIIIDTIVNFDNSSSDMESSGPTVYQVMIDDYSVKSFKIGETYTVIWDRQTYECVAKDVGGIGALGNASLGFEDTGEPFLIGANQGYGYIVLSTEDSNHTLIVKTVTEVIKKLDKKFIDMPDNVVTSEDLQELNNSINEMYFNVESAIDEINSNMETTFDHINNKNNPHDVTVAQIGAAPVDHTHPYLQYLDTDTIMPKYENWRSIAYGNGIFVAIFRGGVAYSKNGITWTEVATPVKNHALCSITYGNGKFVAVAQYAYSNIIIYSTDGIIWNTVEISTKADWTLIKYGNGKFVAAARDSNKLIYSEDGINWTEVTLSSSERWEDIAYGNGKFIMIDMFLKKVAISEDGITWSVHTTLRGSLDTTYAGPLAYYNGKFIALRNGGNDHKYGFQSEDGITWTRVDMPKYSHWSAITYGNGKLVAVSTNESSSGYGTEAAYSEDGLNWHITTLPSQQAWTSVVYGNGKFVAVAALSDAVAYSIDGITWFNHYTGIIQDGVSVNLESIGLATEEYVNTSIANLVDSAPDTLNTLNELATAIQENDNVIDTLNAAITNKVTVPQNAVAGDLLTYNGTNWVRISRADLIAEIIAALPNAEEATF